MPAPAAPGSFTLTQVADGSPLITLAWTHGGTDLDRFEILNRATGSSDPWTRVILAPKADFGAGPYSYTAVTSPGLTWAVRALSAAGEVST